MRLGDAGALARRIGVRAACPLVAGVLLAGCGDRAAGAGGRAAVIVSAAASLSEPLRACAAADASLRPRLSFAGSDELAGQIRRGVRPDVLLSADTELPADLAGEGLLEAPVTFATNELVIATPADSPIDSVVDLTAGDLTLVVGSESVPVGSYTREVLGRLTDAQEAAILANVGSEEPDVKGVVGKLVQGAADAGFVYRTDVRAARGELRAVRLPAGLQPGVRYGGAVVRGAPNPRAARRYLADLRTGACARALRTAGFGPPPPL